MIAWSQCAEVEVSVPGFRFAETRKASTRYLFCETKSFVSYIATCKSPTNICRPLRYRKVDCRFAVSQVGQGQAQLIVQGMARYKSSEPVNKCTLGWRYLSLIVYNQYVSCYRVHNSQDIFHKCIMIVDEGLADQRFVQHEIRKHGGFNI